MAIEDVRRFEPTEHEIKIAKEYGRSNEDRYPRTIQGVLEELEVVFEVIEKHEKRKRELFEQRLIIQKQESERFHELVNKYNPETYPMAGTDSTDKESQW